MTETAGREEWAVWGECQQDNYRLAPPTCLSRKSAKIKKSLWRGVEFADSPSSCEEDGGTTDAQRHLAE